MRFDVHVHHEHCEPELLLRRTLAWLNAIAQRLENQGAQIMAMTTEFRALIDSFHVATNVLAERLTALLDQLAAGGMSAEDEAAVRAELTAVRDRLVTLGADAENPVPPVEPPPVE